MSQETLKIRTYEFQYGTLHLEKATADSMTDEGVVEHYCTKGNLLEAYDDEMGVDEFFDLEDFEEL